LLIRRLAALSTALNQVAAGAAAILLILMVALILVEIALRFYSHSTFMADALVGYGVAAITFLALGWALEKGTMIRVSVVTQRLSPKARWCADAFSIVCAEALVLFLMFYEWRSIVKLWRRESVSQHYFPIPLWIPESIFFAGLALLALQLLVRLCRLATPGREEEASLTL